MSEVIDIKVLTDSIVLIGPAGVGKSTIAHALSDELNMPVVTLDILRHCPSDIEDIEKRKAKLEARLADIRETIDAGGQERLSNEFVKELGDIKNEIWVCEEQLHLRKMFPTVPNYEQMGFNGEVSRWIEENITKENNLNKKAWHFYQKQFENMLLAAVMQAATQPCIFDLGGGMAVSLESDYVDVAKEIKAKYGELGTRNLQKHFDTSKIGFDHIKQILGQFSHVISLELPSDYKERDTRARRDELNPAFIATGQYDELATDERHKINVGNLVLIRGGINKEKLAEIVNTITALTAGTKPASRK